MLFPYSLCWICQFTRTLGIWNQPNSHPLFIESNNRYHALALKKMRRLLYIIVIWTVFSGVGEVLWVLNMGFFWKRVFVGFSMDFDYFCWRERSPYKRSGRWESDYYCWSAKVAGTSLVPVECYVWTTPYSLRCFSGLLK